MVTPSAAASRSARPAWPFAAFVLLLGCFGFAAVWVLLAAASGRPLAWLAVVAALDAALLVRIAGWRQGGWRWLAGTVATAAMIVAAQWGVIAGQVGTMFGLQPWESALKLGPQLAWTIAGISLGAVDLAWFGAALVIAAVLSR